MLGEIGSIAARGGATAPPDVTEDLVEIGGRN
jgi:hypothetical protein